MATLKRILVALCVGALAGGAAAIAVSPSVIRWWYTPPAMPAGFTCDGPIASALVSLRAAVAVAAVGGGLVAAVLAMVLRRRRAPGTPT